MEKIRFLVFSDFHYKKGMYAPAVEHLEEILRRAGTEGAACIVHAGDFCNDYKGSPELIRLWMGGASCPVYGCYGNHELETVGNAMETVTPCITNDAAAVWGTETGRLEDGSIAYYRVDRGIFRFLFLDSNYSWNPGKACWEHNLPASWGCPEGNVRGDSLGPVQLSWLEAELRMAAREGRRCILVSHSSFARGIPHSPDTEAVRSMIDAVHASYPGTVLLCINGHYHTHHVLEEDGVVFLDVNTAINGYWSPLETDHYGEDAPVYRFTEYDDRGEPVGEPRYLPVRSLTMGRNTHFFVRPLSAVVTLGEDGSVEVAGMQTEWLGGIAPKAALDGMMPCIPNYTKK